MILLNIIENNMVMIKSNLQWISLEFDLCVFLLSLYVIPNKARCLSNNGVCKNYKKDWTACLQSILCQLYFSDFWWAKTEFDVIVSDKGLKYKYSWDID